jgi:NDP-sugar pyrophosphorylase family protein
MRTDYTSPGDLVVLCGGLGTRLRPAVHDRPKPLALIGDRPFIDFVIAPFLRHGVRRVILCTGHLGRCFDEWYADHPPACELIVSHEETPLGTAGAVRHAGRWIGSDPFFVVNGDSVCAVDAQALHAFHVGRRAVATLTLTEADRRLDVGAVTVDAYGRITAFHEKPSGRTSGFHNAGIYVFDRSALDAIPATQPCSLETDWLPALPPSGLYGFVSRAPLYDIGTPERLARFQALHAPAGVRGS